MPPIDASADTATAPGSDLGTSANASQCPGTDGEDTLDLRLPEEFIALCAEADATDAVLHRAAACDAVVRHTSAPGPAALDPTVPDPVDLDPVALDEADTVGRQIPPQDAEDTTRPASDAASASEVSPNSHIPPGDDLLDRVGDWGPTHTPAGTFHLLPVHIERDLPLINRWMNDPAVAEFWELAGPQALTEDHLRVQLTGDGHSVPCLGVLDGTPMSYWELYRADLDPWPATTPPDRTTPGFTSSSVAAPTEEEGWAAPSFEPSPTSSSTSASPALASSRSPTFATPLLWPLSWAPVSGSPPRSTCPPSGPPSWSETVPCVICCSATWARHHFWYSARSDPVPTPSNRIPAVVAPLGVAPTSISRAPTSTHQLPLPERTPVRSKPIPTRTDPIPTRTKTTPTQKPPVLIHPLRPALITRLSVPPRRVVGL